MKPISPRTIDTTNKLSPDLIKRMMLEIATNKQKEQIKEAK